MKKRTIFIFIIFLIVITVAVWWLRLHRPEGTATHAAATEQFSAGTNPQPGFEPGPAHQQTTTPGAATQIPENVRSYVQNKQADPEYDWKRPIDFYGRVLDESNAPVSGTTVEFKWNDLSANGTSSAQATTDANGDFSLRNKTGKRLYVQVRKEGYYSSRRSGVAFEYANPSDGLFTPDPANPVVFQLRHKGPGATLLTSQNGVKDHLGITLPIDGTPVKVNLLEKRPGNDGQLTLSQKKPTYQTWKQTSQWSFRMEISEGGFIEQNDEFPFQAPEDGYQPVVEYFFQRNQSDWQTDLKKDYYIRFGDPPRYGHLHLETSITMNGARLTYAINPAGSRNLEPK